MSLRKTWRTPEEMAATLASTPDGAQAAHHFRMLVNGVPTMTASHPDLAHATGTILRYARMCDGDGVIAIEELIRGVWRPFEPGDAP